MSTAQADRYALGHTPEEYERLRAQARVWESTTGRLLDRGRRSRPGSRCLDAGCGPGETMRLMAQRVGPSGRVVGVDVDETLGGQALAALHDAGHRQCACRARRPRRPTTAIPGAPFDLVYARLLLFHLPSGSPCWRGCGTRSPRAAICSCRTTTCAAVGALPGARERRGARPGR